MIADRTGPLKRVCSAYAVGVLGWQVARRTRLNSWAPFELFDIFGWGIYLPLLPLAAAAAVRGDRTAGAALTVPAAVFAAEYGRRFRPGGTPPLPPGARTVRLASLNLWVRNHDHDGVIRTVEAINADVIALHELEGPMSDALLEALGGSYPHRILRTGHGAWGFGVLSRHPLTTKESAIGPDLSLQEADVRIGDRMLSVLAVHPDVPGSGPADFDPARQHRGLGEILDRARAAPHPVVVIGDLNVSDRHRFYRRLTAGLADSFGEAGRGFGFTWPQPVPLVRIDHILHDRRIVTLRAWTGRIPGSDHRYVAADVAVPPASTGVTLSV